MAGRYDLITTLTLNAQGFEGGINKVKQATKELNQNIKGSTDILSSLGGAMGGIAGEMTNAISSLAGAATGIGLVVAAVGILAGAFKHAQESVDLYLASVDKSKQGAGIFTQEAGAIISKQIKTEAGGVLAERELEVKLGAEALVLDTKRVFNFLTGNRAKNEAIKLTRDELSAQFDQAKLQEKINQGLVNGDRNLTNRIGKELALKKILLEQFDLHREEVQQSVQNAAIEEQLKKDRAIITDKSDTYSVADKKAALIDFEETSKTYAEKRESLINRQIANTKALGELTKIDGKENIEITDKIAALEIQKDNVGKEHWAEEVAENRLLSRVKRDALADELAAEKKKRDEEKAFHELKMKNLLIEGDNTGVKVGEKYYDKNAKLEKAGEADTSGLKSDLRTGGLGNVGSQITATDKALKAYKGTLKETIDLNNKFAESQERLTDAVDSFASSISQGANSFKEFGKSVASAMKQAIAGLLSATIAQAIEKSVAFANNPLIGLALGALAGGLAATLFNSLVPKFSQGGIVGGTSYEGDRVPIMVNSGEGIFTKNQMNNMSGGGQLTTKVSGTDLMIVLNNTMRQNNSFA